MTGGRDVAFGVVVAGRPADVAGADAMVGLLINTVPLRVSVSPESTVADLLDQLQDNRGRTLDHEHLGLTEIHRAVGRRELFDTVFVYENYPTDTSLLSGADGLAVTEVDSRDYYHYPLTVQAIPGEELDLRIQYRADVFDDNDIQRLIAQLDQALVAMAVGAHQPLPALDSWDRVRTSDAAAPNTGNGHRAPATEVERILCGIYADTLGVDPVGTDDSFFDLGGDSLSAMRAVAAINAALDVRMDVMALVENPTVRELSVRVVR
jgi:non-ribosomal peptide synthetase component F